MKKTYYYYEYRKFPENILSYRFNIFGFRKFKYSKVRNSKFNFIVYVYYNKNFRSATISDVTEQNFADKWCK